MYPYIKRCMDTYINDCFVVVTVATVDCWFSSEKKNTPHKTVMNLMPS